MCVRTPYNHKPKSGRSARGAHIWPAVDNRGRTTHILHPISYVSGLNSRASGFKTDQCYAVDEAKQMQMTDWVPVWIRLHAVPGHACLPYLWHTLPSELVQHSLHAASSSAPWPALPRPCFKLFGLRSPAHLGFLKWDPGRARPPLLPHPADAIVSKLQSPYRRCKSRTCFITLQDRVAVA